ncbi:phage neck terminator protein [Bradyrhizobium symbiodeficiens]|uniref:Phage neck terminator protein gp12-like domain-containing protein n=1 Tax=Bradyrhizobium symbiodeficiens TaxID=1404367 RepID=A0A6G9A990_9BRAD|nr:hypothetical protein [Bradyrhizobium symbiodeficiens]QIP09037.1 hypothetical protein HAV00_23490 [Bradyrhizobium symbiodeficiens]
MFLLTILPAGTEVFEGLDNGVPEPQTPGFVTITVLRRPRLATNLNEINDAGDTIATTQSTDIVVQMDVHNDDTLVSSDNAQIISTMFRDDYATTFFEGYPGISPLFADEPRLLPFVNAESQYEPRYTVEVHLQADQAVSVPAQSATSVELDITNVETDPAFWPNSTVTAP